MVLRAAWAAFVGVVACAAWASCGEIRVGPEPVGSGGAAGGGSGGAGGIGGGGEGGCIGAHLCTNAFEDCLPASCEPTDDGPRFTCRRGYHITSHCDPIVEWTRPYGECPERRLGSRKRGPGGCCIPDRRDDDCALGLTCLGGVCFKAGCESDDDCGELSTPTPFEEGTELAVDGTRDLGDECTGDDLYGCPRPPVPVATTDGFTSLPGCDLAQGGSSVCR